jgi:hypothetical protein
MKKKHPHSKKDRAYSMSFPMLSSIEGARDPAVADFIWRLIIVYRM